MARRRTNQARTYNPAQTMAVYTQAWRTHYFDYMLLITTQLFKWKNLPESVDPMFLEKTLHEYGTCAFYKDPAIGYIVTRGAYSGTLNVYNQPTQFQASMPNYSKQFPLASYLDTATEDMGILIRNNDLRLPTTPAINIFAEELAQIKSITRVNMNAQKTPFMIGVDENNQLSLKNMYYQLELNTPAIFHSKGFDLSSLKVFETPAPYLADKLNVQRMNIWNEFMTFLGIENANIEKRERLIDAEVSAINDQVLNSSNIMLKSRLEACELINRAYDLNVTVELRSETVSLLEREGDVNNGRVYN